VKNALAELGNDEKEFMERPIYQKGCALDPAYIGENPEKISQEMKDSHTEIDWDSLRRYGNFVAHGYEIVDLSLLWRQLSRKVPKIREQFEKPIDPDR